ncbi:MAG: hypothetical protein R2734_15670 [Nocardioides sp.]
MPHHGSRYQDLDLCGLAADVAVVSVGTDNDYGIPRRASWRRWTRAGPTWRTDRDGDVVVAPGADRLGFARRGDRVGPLGRDPALSPGVAGWAPP